MKIKRVQPKFIEIDSKDFFLNLLNLVEEKTKLKVWSEKEIVLICQIFSAKKKDVIFLEFKVDGDKDFPDEWSTRKNLLVHFKAEGNEYFARLVVLSIDEKKILKVVLDPSLFKCERRIESRLILFPQFSSYLFYRRFKKTSEKNSLVSFEGDENFKIVGKDIFFPKEDTFSLRVYDIASTGISFFLSTEELKNFSTKHTKNKSLNILLRIDDLVILVKDTLVVYVDQFKELTSETKIVLKMGISFPSNDELTKKLDEISKGQSVKETIQNDFEDFLKK